MEDLTFHVEALVLRYLLRLRQNVVAGDLVGLDDLLARVIGYRATIDRMEPRFKLGQDEAPEDFAAMLGAMGDHPLTDWMHRYWPKSAG